jgi:hypothetical protein
MSTLEIVEELSRKEIESLYKSYKDASFKLTGSYSTIKRGSELMCITKSKLRSGDEVILIDRETRRFIKMMEEAIENKTLTSYKKRFGNLLQKSLTKSGYYKEEYQIISKDKGVKKFTKTLEILNKLFD